MPNVELDVCRLNSAVRVALDTQPTPALQDAGLSIASEPFQEFDRRCAHESAQGNPHVQTNSGRADWP